MPSVCDVTKLPKSSSSAYGLAKTKVDKQDEGETQIRSDVGQVDSHYFVAGFFSNGLAVEALMTEVCSNVLSCNIC